MVKDQRGHPRIVVRYRVTFSAPAGGGDGYILDLSLDGCCMKTPQPVPVRSYVQLRILPLHVDMPILIELAAVRWAHTQECGLQFLSIRPEQRERLCHLIDAIHNQNDDIE